LVRISGKPRVSRNGPETSEVIGDFLNPMASSVVIYSLCFFNCTPAGMTWAAKLYYYTKFRKFDLKHENPTYPHEGGFAPFNRS
jgi:hypothetical protein